MRFADCDRFRVPVGPGALHVERWGFGGSPVVLLHGFGTTAFLWRRIAPELAVSGCTAFALDLFGYGASDRPSDASFGIRAQAAYVSRALEYLALRRVTLVGTDIGAVVALLIAARRTELVERLILVSPSPPHRLPGPEIRLMQRATAKNVVRLMSGLFGVQPLLITLLTHAVRHSEVLSARLVGRYMAPYVGREGVAHFLALARALEDDSLGDLRLREVENPTLVVRGESDPWWSETDSSQLADELPRCRTATLPGAGRLVAEEVPGLLVDCLVDEVRAAERELSGAN